MKNTPKLKKKAVISKASVIAMDDNLIYYQIFYLFLISLLLSVNILFQRGITSILIKRAWGMNNFSYFPWWVQVFVFTIFFTLAVPSVNNTFRLFIQKRITDATEKTTRNLKKIIWFTGISLVIALLFYLFKVKYDLLGDMNLRVSQSVEKKYIDDEYFTMYLMHQLNIVLQKLFHFKPHQTFVFASVAAGFFFSFLGLLIADLLFNDRRSMITFFLFYISIGNLLFFCGYTEIYAIPAVSASLYMYTGLLVLKKKASIILPFFCMVLAVALHKEQVSVLPSFIFLATRKLKFVNKFITVKNILILFIISLPLIYIINTPLRLQDLMPLTKDKQFPTVNTLFSFSYWWELFNSQYISSGILLFLFIVILFKAAKGKIQLDDYSKFFLIATLFIYSIVITMNKMRGSGDWDVCSFPAIYLSMFIAYTALTQWKKIYSPRKIFYILSIALLLNTFSCWAWVGLNSGKKSLNKIEDMLLTDPGWYYQVKLPSEIELSVLFGLYGSHQKAMQYYKLSYDKYSRTNADAATNYIGILIKYKDTNTAVSAAESVIAAHPLFFDGYNLLFGIYNKKKQYDKIYKLAKAFLATYNSNPKMVLEDKHGKMMLMASILYSYNISLLKKDTATTQEMLVKMKQFHITNAPPMHK